MRKAVTMLDNEGNKCYPRTTIENVYGLVSQLLRIDNLVKMITEGSATDLTEIVDARVVGGSIYDTLGQALNALDGKIEGYIVNEINVMSVTWSEFVPVLGMERFTIIEERQGDNISNVGSIRYSLYDLDKNKIEEKSININETISVNNASYIKIWISYATETLFTVKYRMGMAKFSDCVPIDRTIAQLSLSKDITAKELGQKILTAEVDYEFYSKLYDVFPTLRDTPLFIHAIENICDKNVKIFKLKENNEPTINANEYLNAELGDICINESYRAWICQYLYENTIVWSEVLTPTSPYLAGNFYSKNLIDNMLGEKEEKSDWELIRKIIVEDEIGAVEITTNEIGESFAYDDIMVVGNNIIGTASGNWWISAKTTTDSSNGGMIQVGNANPISATTTKHIVTKIKRMFGINKYEYESSHKNTSSYAASINKGIYTTSYEMNESTKINWIRIHFSTNNVINSGSIYVYGRRRRNA